MCGDVPVRFYGVIAFSDHFKRTGMFGQLNKVSLAIFIIINYQASYHAAFQR